MLSTLRFQSKSLLRQPSSQMALRSTSQIDRTFIKPAYDLAKKVTPKISATEAAALDAGTIGFDRDIFAGTPSLKSIKDKYNLEISEEERAFVENEVNELCESFPDEYEMYKNRDLPKHIFGVDLVLQLSSLHVSSCELC